MGIKSKLIKPFANRITRNIERRAKKPVKEQNRIFRDLIARARNTQFGQDHDFQTISNYPDFRDRVPIRDYEGIKPYIEKIKMGTRDVLWPGLPLFFAKTSGTTSGVKYIPLTKESMPHHVNTARDSLFNYFSRTGKGNYFDAKMIYLSGSPELNKVNGIHTGRLSGIVNHQIPKWALANKLPSYAINCIEDWEEKVSKMVSESASQDVRLIGGIPPWVQMYYEKLLEYTGKQKIKEVFPNLSVFVYGGVNYEPYRQALEELVGDSIDSVETYPASEGFFAFQDMQPHQGLLLNVWSGMFYEFVPATEIFDENPTRLFLEDVELHQNYALLISSNAGLWAYNLGDTVEFVSKNPFRIKVTGRVKHFISAFGEHVIGKEVEEAMLKASSQMNIHIVEFTVAPQVNPEQGLPYHEWFVEMEKPIDDIELFAQKLDTCLQGQNIYYQDLIEGKILKPAQVTLLKKGAFRHYMHSIGKLGGQNKVPRLSNDRKIANALKEYSI